MWTAFSRTVFDNRTVDRAGIGVHSFLIDWTEGASSHKDHIPYRSYIADVSQSDSFSLVDTIIN